MFTSIRAKLTAVLLTFVCITILSTILITQFIIQSKSKLTNIQNNIESAYSLLLKDITLTRDFFENETINVEFFASQHSTILDKHISICKEIEHSINALIILQNENYLILNSEVKKLEFNFHSYQDSIQQISKLITLRGFKDYGIEGQMRKYAHELENYGKEIGLINILQLRRHEKDFIIRQEELYREKHKKLISEINHMLINNQSIKSHKKTLILEILNNYALYFKKLIVLEKRIGIKTSTGLKKSIDSNVNTMKNLFQEVLSVAAHEEKKSLATINLIYIISFFSFIITTIFAARYISRKISSSITDLKEKISAFVESDFTKRTILPINNSKFEVDILATNFSIMEEHIVNQMATLKQTNNELETILTKASNDIRNPLLEVKNLTSIASQNVSDPESVKYLRLIRNSWQKLIGIVDELGIVSSIKNGEINLEKIDFECIIKSSYQEHKHLPAFETIMLSTRISLENDFHSSKTLIQTIFYHLFENSIKYSATEKSAKHIKISISEQGNNILKIVISDNGIGIKKEHHHKIFDMFYRTNDSYNGTGLGLYIVRNSLQKINGAISVESEENIGTTFTILIPNKKIKQNISERIIQRKSADKKVNNVVLNYI